MAETAAVDISRVVVPVGAEVCVTQAEVTFLTGEVWTTNDLHELARRLRDAVEHPAGREPLLNLDFRRSGYHRIRYALRVPGDDLKHWLEVLEKMYLVFVVRPWIKKIPRSIQKPFKVYFFDNGEYAKITPEDVSFFDLKTGKKNRKKSEILPWEKELATKGGHPHFMLKEILEERELIKNTVSIATPFVKKPFRSLKERRMCFLPPWAQRPIWVWRRSICFRELLIVRCGRSMRLNLIRLFHF